MNTDPHKDGPIRRFGTPIEDALGAVILLHGRGASADDILSLTPALNLPELAYLAPQASGGSWYPYSFLAPLSQNQPWLASALLKVEATMQLAIDAGILPDRIVIAGFSQGACLATEFVASHPQRYAALIAFTGGLIGPPDADLRHAGDLLGTPALFASGDPDPHVPWQRVQQSAQILSEMGGIVKTQRYPGRPHTVTSEELNYAKALLHDAFANHLNVVE